MNILMWSFATLLIALVFHWCYSPMKRVHNPDKATDIPNGRIHSRASRSRKVGKIPHPFPTGWYKVLDSKELSVGSVRYIEYFDEHLVLFRGENGQAAVLDAYCPHLGANLAVTGKVVGNCLECPFHGWQFETTGKCSHIPYQDKVPEKANTNSWPVMEGNGAIYMYYDADGDSSDKTWTPPVLPVIENGEYVYHGKIKHYVESHIQEIPENGADVAHLGFLHLPSALKWIPSLSHKWKAEWVAGEEPESHVAHINLCQSLQFFGYEIGLTKLESTITQVGPALVFLSITTQFGHFMILQSVTPIKPTLQHVTNVLYGPSGIFYRLLAKVSLLIYSEQFARDIVIWNNKTYNHKPVIVKGDGNILGFRRWYSKFYPKSEFKPKEDLSW